MTMYVLYGTGDYLKYVLFELRLAFISLTDATLTDSKASYCAN